MVKTSEEERLENEVRHLRAQLEQLREILASGEDASLQHALRSLHASEDRYRSLVAAISEGVVLQAADGSVLACNPAAEEILGLSRDQIVGRTSLDPRWRAIHPDGTAFSGAEHPAMVTLRTGEPQRNVPMGVHKPDGTLTWIAINTQPLWHSDPERRSVVSSFTDVTEVREAHRELERSARQLRVALAGARAGAWEWDIASDRVWWSEDVHRVFGLPPGEFDGTLASFAALVHPLDQARVRRAIAQALKVPEIGARYSVEYRVSFPDGSIRWLHSAGTVVRDESGDPIRMSGAVVDVTRSKDLEQRVVQAQKMESVGRLAGGVAHDFNNLLTAVLVSAEVALDRLEEPEAVRRLLEEIVDAGRHGSRLTRQLLAFARRQVVKPELVRVGEVVERCRQLLERLLGEHIELCVRVDDAGHVVADPSQLEQVVMNLAINAGEAMATGGRLEIAVRDVVLDADPGMARQVAAAGRYVELTVSDVGEGIPPEILDKVFDPYFSTKEEGTGLGLATSYGIVHQLDGHMTIESTPGRGTTVRVSFPTDLSANRPKVVETRPAPMAGDETILFVEDEPRVRSLAVMALESYGYRVLQAADAEEALTLAARFDGAIQLLISDVMMPGRSGVELAEELRTTRPAIRVLLTSGYSADHLDSAGAGTTSFLQKPYRGDELARRVRGLMDEADREA